MTELQILDSIYQELISIGEEVNMILGYQEYLLQFLIPFTIVVIVLWLFFEGFIRFRSGR